MMNKGKLKKAFYIGSMIFIGLALAITYFFFLYEKEKIVATLSLIISVLRPIVLGAVFAYIMKSTANFYEKWLTGLFSRAKKLNEAGKRKLVGGVSVFLTLVTWLAVIGVLLSIVIPQIYKSVSNFVNDLIPKLPEYEQQIFELLDKYVLKYDFLKPYTETITTWITTWLENDLIPIITNLGSGIFQIVVDVFRVLVDIIIGLIIAVFLLLGRKPIAKKCEMFLHCIFKEKAVCVITDEFKYADKMFSGFLEGKIIDSTIIGLIYYIVLELLNVPYPALVAVICGVTNIIPIFGPFIGAIPSGVIILTADPIKVLPFVIFVCIIQFLDGYIIDPHIVGGNIKMSSLCVVFAVILFGGLWGFFGLLIGVPTFAVIYDIFKKIGIYLLKKNGKEQLITAYKEQFNGQKQPASSKEPVTIKLDSNSDKKSENDGPDNPENSDEN